MSSPKGFPSNQKIVQSTGLNNNYVTVIPTDEFRNALDAPRFAFRVDSDTVPRTCGANTGNPSSGPTYIHDISTVAKIGDIFRAEDGDAQFIELPICQIAPDGDGFYLSARLPDPPASGDDFYVLRSVTQRTDEDGTQFVVLAPSPIAFEKDGVATTVSQDTAVPANSEPLPTILLNPNGTEVTPATAALQTTGNASLTSIDGKTPALVGGSVPVVGPLTDAELRATPVPVSGTVAVSNPGLTDAELRASPVPVSGPLTDTQLRATPVPVSGTVTANAGTNLNTSALALEATQAANGVLLGAVTETAPASDTASSGLNGRLQRIAQRITSLIALLPTSLGQKTAANSLAVVVASDYVPKAPVNANGSIVNTSLTATTASSASAPANAVGFILEAASSNTDNIRWCIGGTASTTVGMLTEPGRDTGYVPCAATISVCATASGTNVFSIQWILSA